MIPFGILSRTLTQTRPVIEKSEEFSRFSQKTISLTYYAKSVYDDRQDGILKTRLGSNNLRNQSSEMARPKTFVSVTQAPALQPSAGSRHQFPQ